MLDAQFIDRGTIVTSITIVATLDGDILVPFECQKWKNSAEEPIDGEKVTNCSLPLIKSANYS